MAEFYVKAGRALQDILARRGSIKAITAQFGDDKGSARAQGNAKRILALVVNTLSFRSTLQAVLRKVDIATLEPKWFGTASPLNRIKGALPAPAPTLASCILLVLTHDLLFVTRGIQAAKAWPPRERLERHKARLHAEIVRIQLRMGKKNFEELRSGAEERQIAARIPRWCRVNTLRANTEEVIRSLTQLGWNQAETEQNDDAAIFTRSEYVPDVLAFHPRATSDLMRTELYRDGTLILQDLASCFPAAILDPLRDGQSEITAMDATSAPGNKTSHLSALMKGKGKVGLCHSNDQLIALERSPQRFITLQRLLERTGCLPRNHGNVHPQKTDFLSLDPEKFDSVQYMLLDPSCSGSGIVNRLDYLSGKDDEQDNLEEIDPLEKDKALASRLASLASLQEHMIRHAMKFPNLKRFTYSTCSIHEEENEKVVIKVLASEEARNGGWKLASRDEVLPSWPERGHASACKGDLQIANALVRCTPGGTLDTPPNSVHDGATNGFFVCCFVRKMS
ncbi:25S rRNA (cytosine(2278)-C(5))-methyltransferase [Malassezia yamatoensis]|uniref:25S rRNA (Cytosine(2278)-C(5))-methyltransferase n=1 Tax=Malassezia yamatoensis TaxID=253288 RepID=A0AAJ6CHX8_9BASI|nr:25S rRNA (cytosine(2278)-C(5))-methyltransferase [Malassezia yamatoensis]